MSIEVTTVIWQQQNMASTSFRSPNHLNHDFQDSGINKDYKSCESNTPYR